MKISDILLYSFRIYDDKDIEYIDKTNFLMTCSCTLIENCIYNQNCTVLFWKYFVCLTNDWL